MTPRSAQDAATPSGSHPAGARRSRPRLPVAPRAGGSASQPRRHPGSADWAPSSLHGLDVVLVSRRSPWCGTGFAPYLAELADRAAAVAESVTVVTATPATGGPGHSPAPGECGTGRRGDVLVRCLGGPAPGPGRASRFAATAAAVPLPRRPQLVLCLATEPSTTLAATALARRHGAGLVAVVDDAPLSAATGRDGGRARGSLAGAGAALRARSEAALLARAGAVLATEPETLVRVLRAGVAAERALLFPPWTVRPPVALSREQARAALGWPRDGLLVVHSPRSAPPWATRPDLLGPVPMQWPGPGHGAGRFPVRAARLEDAALATAAADILLVTDPVAVHRGHGRPDLLGHLAAGRPVVAAVAADSPVARLLARTGGAGLRVEPGDRDGLTRAVRQLAADPDARERMSRAAVDHAFGHLGRRTAIERLDCAVRIALTPTAGPPTPRRGRRAEPASTTQVTQAAAGATAGRTGGR